MGVPAASVGMPNDEGTTIGIYVGPDDDVVDEFDATVSGVVGAGQYSRSRQIKAAMRLYATVLELADDLEWRTDGAALEASVRQAMLDLDRRERDE